MTATPTQRHEESQSHGATGNTRQATRAHPARCGGGEHGAARASVPEDEATWLEALTCLAAISGVTSRVKLLASVIILPQRNVLELMKTGDHRCPQPGTARTRRRLRVEHAADGRAGL